MLGERGAVQTGRNGRHAGTHALGPRQPAHPCRIARRAIVHVEAQRSVEPETRDRLLAHQHERVVDEVERSRAIAVDELERRLRKLGDGAGLAVEAIQEAVVGVERIDEPAVADGHERLPAAQHGRVRKPPVAGSKMLISCVVT